MSGKPGQIRRRRFWRGRSWKTTVFLFALGAITLFRLAEDITPDIQPDDRFRVVRAVDGDTVELAGGDRLRLLYLDTPERGQPYADSAQELVESLVLGRIAELEYGIKRRDGYGRLLALIECDSSGILINVNERLLERGFAYIYLFADNIKDEAHAGQIERLLDAQKRAISAKRGIWSLVRSPEPRYLTTLSSLRFHRETCRSVAGKSSNKLREFSSRREPLFEGLSPCRNCRP